VKNTAFIFSLAIALAGIVSAQEHTQPSKEGGAVQVQMHNVMYHFSDNVYALLRNVGGALVPSNAGQIPVFDDKKSFSLQINAAEIAMSPQSLANALNSNVFDGKDSPLKDIAVSIEKGSLKVKGKLHKKGDVGFETQGQLSATPDGKIRLHAEKIRALHLPVKGMMDLFGIDIADLIKNGKVKGVQTEKDDLILDPTEILPPPRISGKVTDIRLESDNIVLIFGQPKSYHWQRIPAQNYMVYRGNSLRFGKLTMTDTDLLLVDPDPRDPFDFYFDHYKDQLVAGYSKTTETSGLRVYMIDFNKLKQKPAKNPAARKSR
jgi:hypothetical protein